MLKKIGIGIAAGVVSFGIVCLLAVAATEPEGPAADSTSAARLLAGPYSVQSADYTFVDTSRPMVPNGDFPGADARTLKTTIWFPSDKGPHPLVIYSHGFMSFRTGGKYIAEHLASHGIIVASTDFPLTNYYAPGGPLVTDVVNQPADVSFLIDAVLALDESERPYGATPDPNRIGLMGLSLGGLTTTLSAFHAEMRDPRVRAAVSIAGPASFFTARFFQTTDIPFLMIAGTEDAMVPYAANAAMVPRVVENGALVTIEGGSHTGFAAFAEPFFRFYDHPDSLGCRALMGNLETEGEDPLFPDFGGEAMGVVIGEDPPTPCQNDFDTKAIHPGRQHMITTLAVWDFFDSVFNDDPKQRSDSRRHLVEDLKRDFPQVQFAHHPSFRSN